MMGRPPKIVQSNVLVAKVSIVLVSVYNTLVPAVITNQPHSSVVYLALFVLPRLINPIPRLYLVLELDGLLIYVYVRGVANECKSFRYIARDEQRNKLPYLLPILYGF